MSQEESALVMGRLTSYLLVLSRYFLALAFAFCWATGLMPM